MYNMGAVTSYVCDKYYYVVYKNDNLIECPIKGLLLNYASGNIVLLADEGIYHIKYNDIILMKPIKNFPLERCSEEFQKLIQSFNTECSKNKNLILRGKNMICNKEEMIQRVKDCGQEVIDHAENIVNDYKYGTQLTISCYINWCDDGCTPRINVETELIPERFIKRLSEV